MNKILLAQQLMISGQSFSGPLVGINTLGDVVNKVLPFLIMIAGLLLLFIFIWGGYDLINSGGEPGKIKSAQGKIVGGLIGFGLLIASFVIVKVISFIFGFGVGIL